MGFPPAACSLSAASFMNACKPAICARWADCGRAFPTCRRLRCSSSSRRWGLPGLGNFIGEFLILLGTFKAHPNFAVVAASGLVLSAVYSLILMQRAFHGKPKEETPLRDLNRREIATLTTLMVVLVWLGLYPQPVLDVSRASMQALQALYAPAETPTSAPVAAANGRPVAWGQP